MIHDFLIVWRERDLLLAGLTNTIVLSLASTVAALLLGALLTVLLMSRRTSARFVAGSFVDAMRCIPFLLFAYIVYYGLPSVGVNFGNWNAGLVALIIYNTAYMAEILRGAWAAQPIEPIDAGYAFGFTGLRHFRRIVLPPLLLSAAPVIGNQVI